MRWVLTGKPKRKKGESQNRDLGLPASRSDGLEGVVASIDNTWKDAHTPVDSIQSRRAGMCRRKDGVLAR